MISLLYADYRAPGGCRRSVHCWNAADVLREDGMLHHGTVVGAAPEGLLVDFGCPGQRRQLVEYGSAYTAGCYDEEPLRGARPGSGVEVLLRQEPAGPWVWRPGTLVTQDIPEPNCGHLTLVDVQLAGVMRREVLHTDQVRPPPSSVKLRSRILGQDDFQVSRLSPLPAGMANLLPTHLAPWKALCQRLSEYLTPISVSSTELVYLRPSRRHYLAESESVLKGVIRSAPGWIDAGIEMGAVWVAEGWQCSGSLACASPEVEDSAEWTLQNLVHLVVEETLTYLGTMQRASLRRVCRLFDELICGTLCANIWLTYRECGLDDVNGCCGCSDGRRHYPLAAPLFKCVTPRTRRIILTDAGESEEQRFMNGGCVLAQVPLLVGICQQLGQCPTGPGQAMVLVAGQCEVQVDEWYFWTSVSALATSLAGGRWKKLLFQRCTMTPSLPGIEFSGSVRVSSLAEDLGAAVERHLPSVDVQRTREWVAQVLQGQMPGRDVLQRALNEFVTLDPRHNAYAGYTWTDEHLAALDVARLSHLAQYALGRHVPPPNLFAELPEGF